MFEVEEKKKKRFNRRGSVVPIFVILRKTNGTYTAEVAALLVVCTAAVHYAGLGDEARGTRQAVSSTISSAELILVHKDNLGLLLLEPSHFCSSGLAIFAVCSCSFLTKAEGFCILTASAVPRSAASVPSRKSTTTTRHLVLAIGGRL